MGKNLRKMPIAGNISKKKKAEAKKKNVGNRELDLMI